MPLRFIRIPGTPRLFHHASYPPSASYARWDLSSAPGPKRWTLEGLYIRRVWRALICPTLHYITLLFLYNTFDILDGLPDTLSSSMIDD